MDPGSNFIGESGLRFFGKVTASVSHEIRNVLAIINENAGLLEDLALNLEKGIPLEAGRVKTITGKLQNNVRRGDEIVNNMNRFAHSIDEPLQKVDMGDILDMMTRLAQRTASTKRTVLEHKIPETPIVLTTRPFLLENVIWLCLNAVIDAAAAPATITLIAEPVAGGVQVSLNGLEEDILVSQTKSFLGGEPEVLLNALGADWTIAPEAGAVIVRFPDSVS